MKETSPILIGLLLLVMPVAVNAQFQYSINPDGVSVTITNYDGSGGAVSIPTNIDGYTVTGIGEDAFYYSMMTSVTLPASLTTIGQEAFYGCGYLETVAIPASVTNIGPGAFAVCIELTSITVAAQNEFYSSSSGVLLDKSQHTLVEYPSGLGGSYTIPSSVTNLARAAFEGCTSLTHVTIPSSMTSVGEYAFEYCYDITSMTLPATLTNIADHAFDGCNALAGITIPASVTSIGAAAFYGCYALAGVTIPSNVVSIGAGPFEWCIGLTVITVAGQNPSFSSSNGVMFDKSRATLIQFPCGLGGSYAIPNTVTSIAPSAFDGCEKLTGVTVPASVASIGDDAFYECYDLVSITIPASVTNLGVNVFYGCNDLTNVTLSSGISNIGNLDFYGCYGLTSVTIPASVSALGEGAFEYCIHLTNVYFMGAAPSADSTVFLHDSASPTAYYLTGAGGWSSGWAGISTVLWNPSIRTGDGSFGVQNQQFGFNIVGTNNFTLVVQACPNLAQPIWMPIQTVTLTNGLYYFSDPQWTNYPTRFYGLALP